MNEIIIQNIHIIFQGLIKLFGIILMIMIPLALFNYYIFDKK